MGRAPPGSGRNAGRISPCRERLCTKAAVGIGGGEVTAEVERVVGRGMHRQEPLRRGGRLEPLQLALTSTNGDVRALGPVVLLLGRDVDCGAQAKIAKRSGVGRTLVGDPLVRGDPLLPEKLAHQLAGCSRVPPCLNQHLILGIDCPPEVHLLAADPDEHLVEVPSPVQHQPPSTKTPSDCGTEPITQRRIVSYDTSMPRSASRSSTSR